MPQATTLATADAKVAHQKRKTAHLEVRAPPLPKVTAGFVPLPLLVDRLVQHSWNGMQEMMDGLATPGLSDLDKKMRLLKFAQANRQQFIKCFVLTSWAENAAAVSDVIDLRLWLSQQKMWFDAVPNVLGDIRRMMGNARRPNPDLRTAMEILATGQPKLGIMKRYVHPPKLTSRQLLDALRRINAILSIRLALHENIPPYFREYRLASGRATFTVKDEFEVDLSIGDETLESQLFMVDVRPLWEPSVRPYSQELVGHLEGRGNPILKKSGLSGLFDFLHEFTVSGKLLVLRQQAEELARRRWSKALFIQQIKRFVVIQYWPTKIAEKSWIEIGMMKGEPTTQIGVRWWREKKLVKDQTVPIDLGNISAAKLIRTVVTMHTNHLLTEVRDGVHACFQKQKPNAIKLHLDPEDSSRSYLDLHATPEKTCRLIVDPTSGLYSFFKPNETMARTETYINRQAMSSTQIAQTIFRLMLTIAQLELHERAQRMGWTIIKTLSIAKEDLKKFFPPLTKYMCYMRRPGWGEDWYVTYVQEDSSSNFWILELDTIPGASRNTAINVDPYTAAAQLPPSYRIRTAQQIPMRGELRASYTFLEHLEKMAAGTISQFVNSRELAQSGTQFTFRATTTVSPYASAVRVPDLLIRFSSLLHATWGIDVLKICFQGLSPILGHNTMVVVGRTKEPMTQLGEVDLTTADTDVSFHPGSGSFVIRFVVPVGTPIIAQAVEKLLRIERLISFVSVVRALKLNCLHVSLGRIVFRYSDAPVLHATIEFGGDDGPNSGGNGTGGGGKESGMKLILPRGTPHVRMHPLLQRELNAYGLGVVVKALIATLPIMLAFDDIERPSPPSAPSACLAHPAATPTPPASPPQPFVLARGLDWFRLDYRRCSVDIRLRTRRGMLLWHVTDAGTQVTCETLREVFEIDGDGWWGLKTGAAAELKGVREIINILHSRVGRWFESGCPAPVKIERPPHPHSHPNPQPTPQQQQVRQVQLQAIQQQLQQQQMQQMQQLQQQQQQMGQQQRPPQAAMMAMQQQQQQGQPGPGPRPGQSVPPKPQQQPGQPGQIR